MDFSELTKVLDGFLEIGVPFYDCVVMKDGRCVYRRANGYTDVKNKVRVTGKEIYNIYSCSKLITCTAALQLCEKGKIALDDELCRYLPEFEKMYVKTDTGVRAAENKITIKQLFTMTAGLSYELNSPMLRQCKEETGGRCPTRETMKYLAKEPLLFEPGYRWEYSLCHDVLAAVVEEAAGMKFGEYVKKYIFDICSAENSTFLPENNDEIINQYRYDYNKNAVVECSMDNAFRLGTEYESGGAGCVSTVDDYIGFLEALRTGRLLKDETVKLLSTNQLTMQQISMPTYWVKDKRGYGLGQQCPTEENTRPDFGWGGAAGAYYFVDRKNNITAYFGTHVLGFEKLQQTKSIITNIIQEIYNRH